MSSRRNESLIEQTLRNYRREARTSSVQAHRPKALLGLPNDKSECEIDVQSTNTRAGPRMHPINSVLVHDEAAQTLLGSNSRTTSLN